ncbi:MAG: hypothetical protein HKN23_20720 [Verrucomicrobiales bacterium]|nr:hypothetical protein [Verrucomicrobiales bacterium]
MATRNKQSPGRLLLLFLPSAAALILTTGCITTSKSTDSGLFENRFVGFQYCSVEAVRQSRQKSCGAAALTAVLNYWKLDSMPEYREKDLMAKYPAHSPDGYPLLQLREMAINERFGAFAISMSEDPWKKLTGHISAGRPVLVAVRLPRGKYFGKSLPLVETLDRRTVWASGNEWKAHYVVVMGFSYSEALFMDPEYGIVRVPRDQFLHFWKQEKYAALIVSTFAAEE